MSNNLTKASQENHMFLTKEEKMAKDSSRIKAMLDNYADMGSSNESYQKEITENRNLHLGKWPEMTARLNNSIVSLGSGEQVDLSVDVSHYPKLNNATNLMIGNMMSVPLVPVIVDYSSYGRKYVEEAQMGRMREFYNETIYKPQEQMIVAKYMEEMGITDFMSLSPEEQKQMSQDLKERTRTGIPREIIDDLQKIRSPEQNIRQILINHDIKYYNLEDQFYEGCEDSVLASAEYYQVGIQNFRPLMKRLDPADVKWYGSRNCKSAENGSWATYGEFITAHELINDHAYEVLRDPKWMDKTKDLYSEMGPNSSRNYNGDGMENLDNAEFDFTDAVGQNPDLVKAGWNTKEGQRQIQSVYANLLRYQRAGYGIRRTYCTWKWSETVKILLRYNQKEDKVERFFLTGNYRKNAAKGDIKVIDFPINRVYHGYKIGKDMYADYGPVEWQFRTEDDIFNSKLTIYGRKYKGNTTLLEPAKIYQLRYNISASKLEELEKNDLGNIIFWNIKNKPEKWTVGQYMTAMLKVKNVPIETDGVQQDKGTKPIDAVDMSGAAGIDKYIQRMDMWEREMFKVLGLNPEAMGYASQYSSNQLAQSNIQASDRQMAQFYQMRRSVKESVLRAFLDASIRCTKDDERKKAAIFSDFDRTYFDTNYDQIRSSDAGLFLLDDFNAYQQVQEIRAQLMALIQNGQRLSLVVAIMKAKTVSEMEELIRLEEIRQDEREAASAQAMSQQSERELNIRNSLEELKGNILMLRDRANNDAKLAVATVSSQTLEKANDVNQNNQNDASERFAMDLQQRQKEFDAKLAQDRKEFDDKMALEYAKIRKEKLDAANKPAPAKA